MSFVPVISDGVDEREIMAGFHDAVYPAQPGCCRFSLSLTLKQARYAFARRNPSGYPVKRFQSVADKVAAIFATS